MGGTWAIHVGYLAPKPRGDDAGNKVNDDVVELNDEGGEMLANPASSSLVFSSLGRNTAELNHVCVNADLHDGSTSIYETC